MRANGQASGSLQACKAVPRRRQPVSPITTMRSGKRRVVGTATSSTITAVVDCAIDASQTVIGKSGVGRARGPIACATPSTDMRGHSGAVVTARTSSESAVPICDQTATTPGT